MSVPTVADGESPFTVTVYDKTLRRVGTVGDLVALTAMPRHNALSTASLTVRSDHHRLADLAASGARCRIDYLGSVLMTGRVRLRRGTGPRAVGTVTLRVDDDWRLFTRVQGWPNPAGGPTQQGDATREDVRTGTAEAVTRGFVQANAITRLGPAFTALGQPVTLGPDGGRGDQVTVRMRFHPLADRLMPAIDRAGIGVTVRQAGTDRQGTGLQVDVYQPATYPRTLTEASGVVQDWGWSRADPDVTRVMGGGEGEGTARTHRHIIDALREAEWGDLIEGYRDARDIRTADIGWENELDTRIRETLTEGAPKAGLTLKLAETATFRYDPTGQAGVRVGDRVRVEVAAGVTPVEDVLREAELSLTPEDGVQVVPVIGDRTDDPNRGLVRAVAGLARAFRDTTRR